MDGFLDPLTINQFAFDALLVVLHADDLLAGNLLRRILTVVDHHRLDLVRAALTRAYDIDGRLALEAVLLVDIEQVLIERHTLVLGISSNLADEADSRGRTFIANGIVRHEAERLLAAADIFAFAFPFADTSGNPLEARVLVGEGHALAVSNTADDLAGDDGLNQVHVVAHLAQTLHVVDDIIAVHHAGLVTVDDDPFVLVVAADDGDTVGIGVAGDDEVCAEFGTQVHTHGHSLCILGVGADHGGEVTVDNHLFGHYVDVLKAPAAQAHRYDLTSGAMQRRIDDVEVLLAQDDILVNHHGLDSLHEVVVHLAADDLDEVLITVALHVLHLHLVHLVDDTLVMGLQHLATVLPVCLVSVVLAGVMAGGHVDAALTLEVTDGEAHLGRRTERFEQIDLYVIGSKDVGDGLGKEASVVAAVVPDDDADLSAFLQGLEATLACHLVQVVGVALRSLCHHVLVHTVGAGTHDAAQATGTELEGTVERVDEFRFIVSFHHLLDLCFCLGIVVAV